MLGITFNPKTWKSDLHYIFTLKNNMTETTVCKLLHEKEYCLEFVNEMENHQRKQIYIQTEGSSRFTSNLQIWASCILLTHLSM